jgi:ribokinase
MLLVLGSINADLLFKVATLPSPGETVLCPGYSFAPGGKGANQAAAAAKAGAEVRFVGHVGDDAYGPIVKGLLADAGVDTDHLAVSPRPTAIAVIGVDEEGENAIIVASGANLDTSAGQVPDGDLGPGMTVLCQNEIRLAESLAALRRGHAAGARTILNLAPAAAVPAGALGTLDVLIVNELEARAAAGTAAGAPETVARDLAERHGLVCVVTLGKAGALGIGRGEAWRIPVLPISPIDTTGAGDAFSGVLAAGLDTGLPLEDALRRASVAAALACEQVGAQSSQPTAAMIDARLPQLPPSQRLGPATTG